ncbi:hypothetical protein LJC60_09770 [Ruminococcaceae bacterium OttesenSCG-928-D13]|nr:hypothetical protein [Ruminococcaceae bacterium OttesenSCG-928-D13]
MIQSIEMLEKYIPPSQPNNKFIKRITAYIPIREQGLNVLVRKNQNISFIHETVLRMIAVGINNIDIMSKSLGLTGDVYKEIIAQMAIDDLVFVSTATLGLTGKGEHALQKLQKVVTENVRINKVFVHGISGSILPEEPKHIVRRPLPSDVYLEPTVQVDIGYFKKHFEEISNIYQAEQLGRILGLETPNPGELYKIIDIAYEEIRFIPVTCFVFLNESRKEFSFSFENDHDMSIMSTAVNQLNSYSTGMQKIFDAPIPNSHKIVVDTPKMDARLASLIEILAERKKTKVDTLDIEERYFCSRSLLDGEERDMMIHCDDFKTEELVISTPRLRILLEDGELLHYLCNSSSKRLIINYNKNEYGADKAAARLKQKLPNHIDLQLLANEEVNGISNDTIIFYPQMTIKSNYQTVDTKYGGKKLLKKESYAFFDVEMTKREYMAIVPESD